MCDVAEAAQFLRARGVPPDAGLSRSELKRVELEYDFVFADKRAELLRAALPLGGGWPDWRRHAAEGRLQLVPVHFHRFLLAEAVGPVLPVHQTDVIVVGFDLLDSVHQEFGDRKHIAHPAGWATPAALGPRASLL